MFNTTDDFFVLTKPLCNNISFVKKYWQEEYQYRKRQDNKHMNYHDYVTCRLYSMKEVIIGLNLLKNKFVESLYK